MEDCIIVSGLEVMACVGVTEVEREGAQRLTISLWIEPERGLAGLGDDIAHTIDYAAVCDAARHEAEGKPRRLIETVAEDIAVVLLEGFPLRAVEVRIRRMKAKG